MKRLIEFSNFIKKANFQKEKELYSNKNYSKLKYNSLIFHEKTDSCKSPDQPFPKIVFTPNQRKSDVINFSNNNYNNENDLCIKRALLENSLSNQRKIENKSVQNQSYTSNEENNNNINKYKVFFPILKINKNNIKENSDNNLTNEPDSFRENNFSNKYIY